MKIRSSRNAGIPGPFASVDGSTAWRRGSFGLALVILFCPGIALGQNNTTGSIFGRVLPGSTITAEHEGMGFKRSTVAATDGAYRITALPPGTYKVSYTDATGAGRTRETSVAIASGTPVEGSDVLRMEKFLVGGMSINPVDFSNTTNASIFTERQLEILPVGRTATEVALLAPGTVVGDTAYGSLPSIGGASVAENAYFINGFNVSNFRTGLSPSLIPFEFYSQFEVNTAALSKRYKLGLRGIAREFGYAIDDMIVNHALETWARANGFPGWTFGTGRAYVLGNAGRPISMSWDFNRNGTLDANEQATLTSQMLGYPRAVRKYYAVEFTAEKVIDGKWGAQFSYTWAHSYGNYEGLVHSDSGQAQAGLSRLFDTPALTMNTFGDQPNDKRHQFKLFGTFVVTPELTFGTNLHLLSGRPLNRIGLFNDPIVGTQYGAYYHLVPRGSGGRTPWQFRGDLTLTYRPKWLVERRLSFGATVFNVLNRLTPTERAEFVQTNTGAPELTYGLPSSWQSPRSVRLSARYEY